MLFMRQKITSLLSIIFLFSLISNAQAGGVGVIDLGYVTEKSKAVSHVRDEVDKKKKSFQKEIDKKQKELISQKEALVKKQVSLAKEDFEKEQKKFATKVAELKEFAQKKQDIITKASQEAMAKINNKMKEIIAEVARQEGYSVIVTTGQTAFVENSANISKQVVDKLNKTTTEVKVNF